jgi:putative tricarboxylic transport membrane protein
MGVFDYVLLGIQAVFLGPELFSIGGLAVPVTPVMVFFGFLLGILVGATPGLAGPMAMAVALPILISVFGFTPDALLPVMGFLIGVMKGATIGGAVPAILFNTPGTPDAYMTTLDGHPMAKAGQARKALKIAHVSSAAGDTFSDIVLIFCAPFLAVMVEAYLDLPEKTALLILSLAFISSVIGGSPGKGLIAMGLGLLASAIGTGEDFYPRLSMGSQALAQGFPVTTAVLGVLIIGEVFKSIEDLWRTHRSAQTREQAPQSGDQSLHWSELRRLLPFIGRSAVIGTAIGALPGIGSTLAATLGYTAGRRRHAKRNPGATPFGQGAPEGIAATEAANSSVSGANLIPVLSLGIPGNAAAVFLILAADSIGGFNPGPSVFKFSADAANPELVIAFGLFTAMMVANLLNWTIGGAFMRGVGVMIRVPKHILLPVVLMLTLTAIYVQDTRMAAIWFAIGFGVLGYLMRRLGISPLPFVIAFILGGKLEDTARQAFAATGGDSWFLFTNPLAAVFMLLAVAVVVFSLRRTGGNDAQGNARLS